MSDHSKPDDSRHSSGTRPADPWQGYPVPAMRHEAWFGDRVLPAFTERPASVWAMFAASVARCPAAQAWVCDGQQQSYTELHDSARRLAAGLQQQGVQRGERVLLFISNRPEFLQLLLALQCLGVIAVPVGVREQRPGLAYIARQCGAVAVVADADLADRLPQGDEAPALRLRVSVGAHDAGAAAAGCVPLQQLLGDTTLVAPTAVGEHDTAVILYTSGTTGHPKGAMLTHANIAHSVLHYQACMRLGPADRSALAVPASHVTGLIATIASMLHVGGCTVIVPVFKAEAFIALMAQQRISHTLMVPAMYTLCLMQAGFAEADLAAWRVGGYGGAPMPVATIDALAQRLPGLTLLNAYGATETTSPTTMMPAGQTRTHADTVGVPLPAARVMAVDEAGHELPPGEVGELWVSGPMVVRGYWANPEATAAGFTAGWWHSGDLGSVDADGYVRVFDRQKDMLNRGGYKIYSAEVESVLMGWPGLVEAAIVGRPCPVLGERVHAFVHGPAALADDAALRAFCAARLADYKVPETISWCPEPLPRNANGKLMKRLLRQQLA